MFGLGHSVLVTALVSAALLTGLEDAASACEPPPYDETVVSPPDGGSLPASAPGIVLSGDGKEFVQLFDAANQPIAGSFKTDRYFTYFAPSAPLAPGAYTARYQSYESGPSIETAFTVTSSVAAPTKTGTLGVASTDRLSASVSTTSGSCTEDADVAIVDLALELDPGFAPYRDVVVWQTKVDGQHWYEDQRGPETNLNTMTYRRSLRLYTACDTDGTSGRDDGVSPGTHDVEIAPMLIGSTAAIAPAKIRVVVTCDSTNGTVMPAADSDPASSASDDTGGTTATFSTRATLPARRQHHRR